MQQQVAGAGTTSHKLHSGASTGSQCVRMHPVFLYFKPSFWEQQYFAQVGHAHSKRRVPLLFVLL